MNNEQQMVREWYQTIEECPTVPSPIPDKSILLRITLLQEEVNELALTMLTGTHLNIAKELADVLYITYGTAVLYGLDMEPIFREVHRSNLTKTGTERRADGKILKSRSYQPADLAPIIEAQGEKS